MTQILEDGHSTLVSFSEEPAVLMKVISATPPTVDGRGAIEIHTMENVDWVTKAPKKLKDLGNASITVAYDPAVLDQIIAMVNVKQMITWHFPDGDQWSFPGYLNSFSPGELVEGERPTAECEIIPTNAHPVTGAELGPEHTAAASTSTTTAP